MKPMFCVLAVVMLFSFAGCGQKESKPVVALWQGAGLDSWHTGASKEPLLAPFGKEWNAELAGLGFGATVVVDVPDIDLKSKKLVNRLVITSTNDGAVYAFDWDTGENIWKQKFGGAMGDPLFVDNKIIATCSDGSINALSAWDGSPVWSARFRATTAIVDPIWNGRPENAALVTDGKAVYSVHSSKTANAYNVVDGSELWRFDFQDAVMASPVLVDDKLIVADYSMKLTALKTENGKGVWESALEDRVTTSLVSDGKNVYVPGSFGKVGAYSAADGKKVWALDIGGTIAVAPCIADKFLAIADTTKNDILFVTTDTGMVKNKVELKNLVPKSALVSCQNYVCFGTADGKVIAVDLEKFSFTTGFEFDSVKIANANRIYGSPAVLEGRLLISDGISTYYLLAPKALLDSYQQQQQQSTPVQKTPTDNNGTEKPKNP